ncbi:MAG: cobyric acid synthase [Candidatus Binataceae bacterium]
MRNASGYALLGTASNVGKSALMVALCRYLRRQGVKVAPFKAINIALNSAATPDGGEIGLAQAQQALAAGMAPNVYMNPVLIKPSSDGRAQYVLLGRANLALQQMNNIARRDLLRQAIRDSYFRLASDSELVMIEGSGSAAEMNLLDHDLSNLWMARTADARCVLVADIDRGGVFASVLGTFALMSADDRERFDGFIINKFQGDPKNFDEGVRLLQDKTAMKCLGIVPVLSDLRLKVEDVLSLNSDVRHHASSRMDLLRIGILKLPHISNFPDFDALATEPTVRLEYLSFLQPLQGIDALVIPGTKSTLGDLEWLRRTGWAAAVTEYARNGGYVVGICGGLQILGLRVEDPHGVEGAAGSSVEALGLLPVRTEMALEKITEQVRGRFMQAATFNIEVVGYEIHMGRSDLVSVGAEPLLELKRLRDGTTVSDGAVTRDGRIWGTYVHGLFDNDHFRLAFLNGIRKRSGFRPLEEVQAYSDDGYLREIDRWTDHVMRHLDGGFLERLAHWSWGR